jgi:hypothetical protein
MRSVPNERERAEEDGPEIDLSELAFALKRRFRHDPPIGYARGRALLEEAVAARLACSPRRAERLVRDLVEWGFVEFDGDAREIEGPEGAWRIVPHALS